MNLPNLLSLSRIAFLFLIAALLFLNVKGAVMAALVCFIIAALTDWADGYVARRFKLITDFGKLMDALADKVLMVGMFVILVSIPGFLPRWSLFLVLIIIGREFLITGLRLVAASRGVVLAAEKGGKIKTVFQILAASVLLLALSLARDFGMDGVVLKTLFWTGMGLFVFATGLTLQSGATYLTKYWFLFKPVENENSQK
ncbi:CDP-diacylglycerol--glycerol-3-phosphate 3-phosphatidyltransferase [Cerasicoccus arenae]|uniref:CDP-diacylglycerol--glycerol-3-phosphate 3-phosphatidyltransferase n=1 Tax=Cerasicoccus arenae TaxID=424488 RepID=UPI0016790457|nr:CDP-diacylglycerol--glycerol-3-phosphate 3-phosphatidyltransferase [Cerasicoccus arenae]MBK1857075.1 CDP-diacylglycerol--glycerol-3-phosphate 3-phosphatidyltransferase [Cerasicoccus arenae]